MSTKPSQADRILHLLQAAWPNWTPTPQLAKISLQYSSRIVSLRRRGWEITNRVEIRNGTKWGYFRLGSPLRREAASFAQSGSRLPKSQPFLPLTARAHFSTTYRQNRSTPPSG